MITRPEVRVSIKKASLYFAHNPSKGTMYRWRTHGVLNGYGQKVKLKFWMDGGRNYTTEEEIQRFKESVREGRE